MPKFHATSCTLTIGCGHFGFKHRAVGTDKGGFGCGQAGEWTGRILRIPAANRSWTKAATCQFKTVGVR